MLSRHIHVNIGSDTKFEATVHYLNLQFSSVAQSCPTLCNPMSCSTPGLPVHHLKLGLLFHTSVFACIALLVKKSHER